MGDKQVRINRVKPVDKDLEHGPFALEYLDVRSFLLFDLLLNVEWKWLLVKFPEQSETLEILIFRWSILINVILDNTRNHRNLLCVVL